mmetsp:Transcript_15728/g.26090  ORF Transcript_15728/g.26090 Transcript_15728/m.26090 type:complete len:129 (+) Transcript_15728:510-896(+)
MPYDSLKIVNAIESDTKSTSSAQTLAVAEKDKVRKQTNSLNNELTALTVRANKLASENSSLRFSHAMNTRRTEAKIASLTCTVNANSRVINEYKSRVQTLESERADMTKYISKLERKVLGLAKGRSTP